MSTEPMTEHRRRCGIPCLTHQHTCDRSPLHTGVHRDVQQNGQHTCEWDTPGFEDVEALTAEVGRLRAESAAEFEKYQATLGDWIGKNARYSEENAVLRADVERLTAERDKARSGALGLGSALDLAAAWLRKIATADNPLAELGDLLTDMCEADVLTAEEAKTAKGNVERFRAREAKNAAWETRLAAGLLQSTETSRSLQEERDQLHADLGAAQKLLADAYELRKYGEDAPGMTDTWQAWDQRAAQWFTTNAEAGQ
jgi:hypothetical protein